jgi:DNA-directed RNA polymerase specialized sigma24 family protein
MPATLSDVRTREGQFASTRWTVVLAAGASDVSSARAHDALSELCRIYWRPLYLFLRREGIGAEDAQDLTQGFFAELIGDRSYLRADREKGRFRSFLLGALKHFVADARDREQAQKRGGGKIREPFDEATIRKRKTRSRVTNAGRRIEFTIANGLRRCSGRRSLALRRSALLLARRPCSKRYDLTFRRMQSWSPTTSCPRGCGGQRQRCAKMRRDCAAATARSCAKKSAGR